jgi:lysophospholipase L1-like esterase
MRLICFGDSWTAGHGLEEDIRFKHETNPNDFVVNYRNNNSYPRWLSDILGVEFVNMGVAGFGNLDILERIKEVKDQSLFKKNDIIIVQFSYPHRYRTKKPNNNPLYIFPQIESLLTPYNHFYFNGFYPLFKDEEFDISSLPNYFINANETLADFLRDYEIQHNIGVWEYGSRSVWNDERGFWEGDYHPNLRGYKLIASHIYENIASFL